MAAADTKLYVGDFFVKKKKYKWKPAFILQQTVSTVGLNFCSSAYHLHRYDVLLSAGFQVEKNDSNAESLIILN